jgi:putative SOS response-associated peptidase YedK
MPALGELAAVHDRMPLLLEPARWDAWLHFESDSSRPGAVAGSSDVTRLLTPPSSTYCAAIEIRPVSTRVGDVRNDGPELVQRIAVAPSQVSIVDDAPTLF